MANAPPQRFHVSAPPPLRKFSCQYSPSAVTILGETGELRKTDDNEARFNRWIREHLGLLGKVVRAFSVLPQDREDLLQEMLINLWSSLPRFRGESKETTWIYRVAFNQSRWSRPPVSDLGDPK